MAFVKASRQQGFLKVCASGPAGAGKSYTGLRWLMHLVRHGLAKRVAVIETEAGKINKYAGYLVDGHLWDFDVNVLASFSPAAYVAAINEAVQLGYDAILIDSLSHEWQGAGGALEMVDRLGAKNKFSDGWKTVTPQHTRFIDAILRAPAHVFATVRTKQEYVMQTEVKGDRTVTVPTRVGTKPIQRDGLEYEFEIYLSMDRSHVATVEKTICPAIDGRVFICPDDDLFSPVSEWLSSGSPIDPTKYQLPGGEAEARGVIERAIAAGLSLDAERAWIAKRWGTDSFVDLTSDQLATYERRVEQAERVATAQRADQQAAATHGGTLASSVPAEFEPPWSLKIRTLFSEWAYFKGLIPEQRDATFAALLEKFGGEGVATCKQLSESAAESLAKFMMEALAKAQEAYSGKSTVTPSGDPAPV